MKGTEAMPADCDPPRCPEYKLWLTTYESSDGLCVDRAKVRCLHCGLVFLIDAQQWVNDRRNGLVPPNRKPNLAPRPPDVYKPSDYQKEL